MSTLTPLRTESPQPLPSIPLSPTEEDLSRPYNNPEQHDSHWREGRGKGKFIEGSFGDTSDEASQQEEGSMAEYPPINDEEAETRRVEENLRRWEMAERQRRKAARTSSSTAPNPSLVGDVTRRASLLWPNRRSQQSSHSGLGTHSALKSRDSVDAMPLETLDPSPTPSAPDSPTPSFRENGSSEDPFTHPSDPISPFADPKQQDSAIMSASSDPNLTAPAAKRSKKTPERPVLGTSSSFASSRPPPPEPLGLPPPRTPPPPIDPPYTSQAPGATPAPSSSQPSIVKDDIKEQPVRWWHDWLCGCNEGPDRGGDFQSGRTNPFE